MPADVGICYETFPTDIAIHLSGQILSVLPDRPKVHGSQTNERPTPIKGMQSYYAVDDDPQNFGIACLPACCYRYILYQIIKVIIMIIIINFIHLQFN